MLLWVVGSERLHSKASLLKTMKASKDQKEILAHVLENGCSKTEMLNENAYVGVLF